MPSWLDRLRECLAPGIAVEREIASGGMGHVALGRDTVLDRPVAIKQLKAEMASAVNTERFLREARSAAGLRHLNVVRVHHAGECAGLPYYVMDYVPGGTLAARLADGRLSPGEVARIGLDLLSALGAAHARNLIHRDVKPSNIFLDGGRALLGDFGVAYALDSSLTTLTAPGRPIGTLKYISPEQLRDGPVSPRTDIYAVGLVLFEAATGRNWEPLTEPAKGDWSRVPGHLREPLRRALQIKPEERWPDAAAFADALASGERRARLKRALATPIAAGLIGALVWGVVAPREPVRDLAVFPFGTAALADSTVGSRLASLASWSFEGVTDLRLAPRQRAIRIWLGSPLPPAQRLVELTQRVNSNYGAWALVRPRGQLLEVQLRVIDRNGVPIFEGSLTGDSVDLSPLADAVAETITRSVFSDRRIARMDLAARRRVPPAAQTEFLLGEEAFARDAWLTAERHYIRALQLDPSFVLAGWRLGNARRWMPLRSDPPYPPGLFRLYEADPEALPEVDRYLIEAQFRPSGAPRFERYEKALRSAGDDPYAALLYGDELFHRGPLAGRPLQDAVRVLQRAVDTDSSLAPAWEHLAWALIRLGEAEPAGSALAQLERLAGRPEESEIYLPMFLRMAYELRFGSGGENLPEALVRSPRDLAIAARGALAFDLPETQLSLGSALGAAGETPDLRASGLIARGVALFALGRPAAALADLDSAAVLFRRPGEARLQAAEWRVIPAALGIPGVSPEERERGRAALLKLVGDPVFGVRAAWALALDAYARGDTAGARVWGDRVRGSMAAGERLAPLLDALDHAARQQWDAALRASAPALASDSAGYAPDPFLRSALHLVRGEWLARMERRAEADRAWLWYENVDVVGWPAAEAQPAEVDWALSNYARSRRAGLAMEDGRRSEACRHARRVSELWSEAEPAVADVGRELARLGQRCRQ